MAIDTAIDTGAEELQNTLIYYADRLPELVLAAVVLYAGLRVSRLLQPYVYTATRAVDESLTRQLTAEIFPDGDFARVASGVVKLFVLLYAGLVAARIIGFSELQRELDRIVFYLPDLFGGLLVILLTLAVARVVADRVASGEFGSELGYATEFAVATKVVVVLIGVPIGLEMVGADLQFLYLLADGFAGAIGIGLTAAIAIVVGVVAGLALRDTDLLTSDS